MNPKEIAMSGRCVGVTRWGLMFVLVVGFACFGCGGPSTVTGTVTYKSRPLPKGEINFIGIGGKSASGTINSDGTYFVGNVPPGDVRVTIISYYVEGEDKFGLVAFKKAPPMRSAIPTKYNDPDKSGLKYKIDSRAKKIDITLAD
jgi:hypothetical protein